MKFGDLPIDDALGAILAHKFYDAAGKLVFNKGHVLKHADLALLREQGLAQVTVTQLSDADLHEGHCRGTYRQSDRGNKCKLANARCGTR